ncbi:MAG: type II toxin-antitoxin system HicA family toxin [Elusimicrobia bacterium]|nr:type II toxin-antitoxin system HicA family toxin [Elusimicrobiota bacterium]
MSRVPTDLAWGRIVRALKKAGFVVIREGKHTSMSKDDRLVIIPRHPRIKRETLRGIIEDAGMTPEEFRELL